MFEARTPELDEHEYMATVDAWLEMRDRRLRRRRALRWLTPLPVAAITTPVAGR